MSQAFPYGVVPKMRPLPARRAVVVSVLDVGTSKVACLVARLKPVEAGDALPDRSHLVELIGVGHQRSRGVKNGQIVDMEAAEQAIRLAVDSAERMAGVQIESVIVSVSAGRLSSETFHAEVGIAGHPVEDRDIRRVLQAGCVHTVRPNRTVVHSIPTGFGLDATRGVRDPRGMVGQHLGVDMHIVTAEGAPLRNLMLCVERCHLDVETIVAAPYAAGLASLVDDESEMGVTLIDMGGGVTSVAVFQGGSFVHSDAVALGGQHVTLDLARGLSVSLDEAERLKTLHASVFPAIADEREQITVTPVGENELESTTYLPKSMVVKIVKPRVEETLELVRDRLKASGYAAEARRVVLTGGASQLTGVPDLARRILDRPVRIGRPLGARGLPEAAKGPAFAAPVGLLVFPQVAGIEHVDPRRMRRGGPAPKDTYIHRVGRWLKESF
ncbi:cell division protein FtsA [Methylopila jiangsuensis]|uniref:Cell division protein FtsA n=1 Tax=Methylopila jiangsuensis TaxID=586230 RepID=A0A9W6JFD1_9HYPH|nr:cell division protein FtsA [Methylopila jiangsuensis]MDR6286264.1 cell division protein FtsA [Methylopila jiangsuensis]GLK76027.1 cell division protein FtsA [Methylopila jiangsuensis]